MKEYIVRVYKDRVEWRNKEGQLHREGDLPAVECNNGDKFYHINGLFHREGGLPAIEWNNGSKEYWVNDQRHRGGGLPAIEYADGDKEYYIHDKQITEAEAKRLSDSCNGKIVEINGKKYKLMEV